MIKKLGGQEITAAEIRWIRSWLVDKFQKALLEVGINRVFCSPLPARARLLLFDIFINDLEENITSPLIKFAADTKIRGMAGEEEERASIQVAS